MVRPAALPAAIEDVLRDGLGLPELEVRSMRAPGVRGEEAEPWRGDKYGGGDDDIEGVVPLDIVLADAPGAAQRVLPVILKARHGAGVGEALLPRWLDQVGVRLDRPLAEHPTAAEWLRTDAREIDAYRRFAAHETTRRWLPAFYGARADPAEDEYLLVIERIEGALLMDTGDDVSGWHPPMRWRIVEALADLHAVGLGQEPDPSWPAHVADSASVIADAPLFQALLDAGRRSLPRIVTPEVGAVASRLIETIDEWYPPKDALPRTLVHDDCNPRNACFRADRTAVVYDWELALWDTPQRDLAELLAFTLSPGFEQTSLWEIVERHRRALGRAAGVELDPDAWREGFRIQMRYQLINRVAWQWLFAAAMGASGTGSIAYVPRITAVTTEILRRT